MHIGATDNSPNAGKIVRCVQFIGAVPGWTGAARWAIDGAKIVGTQGGLVSHANDKYLRPLRDTDADDEMLRIAGKPPRFLEKA